MNRKRELSLVNVTLCLMVIFIHVSSTPILQLTRESWQYAVVYIPWRICQCAVPGFLFLGGLKSCLRWDSPLRYLPYCRGRLTRVVLPYVAAVLLFYCWYIAHGYFSQFRWNDLLSYLLHGNLTSHFYFVVLIVPCYLLLPLWRWMVRRIPALPGLAAALFLMLLWRNAFPDFRWFDRVLPTYLLYWAAGCYAGRYYDRFRELLRRHWLGLAAAWVVLGGWNGLLSLRYARAGAWGGTIELVHILYCLAAVCGLLAVALRVSEAHPRPSRLVTLVDGASFEIYLIHPLIILMADHWMYAHGIAGVGKCYLLRIAITYVCAPAICILYVWGKNRLSKLRRQHKTA